MRSLKRYTVDIISTEQGRSDWWIAAIIRIQYVIYVLAYLYRSVQGSFEHGCVNV